MTASIVFDVTVRDTAFGTSRTWERIVASTHFGAVRQAVEVRAVLAAGGKVPAGTFQATATVVEAPAWWGGDASRTFDVRNGRVMIGSRGCA